MAIQSGWAGWAARGLGFMALSLGAAAWGQEPAMIREMMLEIPTYRLGPEEKQPPVLNPNVYPYPMQTEITREKRPERHRAVVLENDYVRVIVLPDLGGRIYAAHDKTNKDFDFVYHNHVIKPGLVAMRGAWLSGGIEWNFPTRGHTVNTMSPVKYAIAQTSDGSVTCTVGTTEWVRRMRWSVQITLRKDSSRLTYGVRLENPTLLHNPAYFWANGAVHAWDETRVTLPPTDYTYAGRRRDPKPWPVADGVDLTWYRNTPNPYDYFSGMPGDFAAAYNTARENGTVLVADRRESMGRKFWTWGTAPGGMIWEKLLTDADGQYIEMQSGRLLTQGDTWIFDPRWTESWEESWYAVKEMGGVSKANARAAVYAAVDGGKAVLGVNTTEAIPKARIVFTVDGKKLIEEGADLRIASVWRKSVELPAGAKACRLAVLDEAGVEVIAYEPGRKEKLPAPELEPSYPPDEQCTAEQLYLKGRAAAKFWNPRGAVTLYEKALKVDAGFTPALRALAAHDYRTGRYAEGLERAKRALARNEDDLEARYYRALCKMKLGIEERTEEDIALLKRRPGYARVGRHLEAALAARRGNWQEARLRLEENPSWDGEEGWSVPMRSAVMRRVGDSACCTVLMLDLLERNGVNSLAAVELALASEEAVQSLLRNDPQADVRDFQRMSDRALPVLRDDPQEWLEAACAYMEMSLWEDAERSLRMYEKRAGAMKHPMVSFYLGYLADRSGRRDEARAAYSEGMKRNFDYVFPFRTEEIEVLRGAVRHLPGEWRPRHLMGLLLTSLMREEEGLKELEAAAAMKADDWTVYACLGEVYLERFKDSAKARQAYERALAMNAHAVTLYAMLDRLYAAEKLDAAREKLFAGAPGDVARDHRFLLRKAIWEVDRGREDEAIAILSGTTFYPWEGWTGAREVYERALRQRIERRMEKKEWTGAGEDLRALMAYPENLGTGMPHRPDFSYAHYHLGICCRELGRTEEARGWLEKAAAGRAPWSERAREALQRLGA